jgi:hypothetical protein
MGVLGNPAARIADLTLPANSPDGAVPRGYQDEQLALGSYVSPGGDGSITPVAVTGTVFQTTNTIAVPSTKRSILIGIPTAITFAVAQQITATLIAGRRFRAAVAGAAEQMPDAATETDKVGAPFNVGASATSTGPRWFWITPQEIPQLQWPLEWVGVELSLPVGPTGGTIYVAFVAFPF